MQISWDTLVPVYWTGPVQFCGYVLDGFTTVATANVILHVPAT